MSSIWMQHSKIVPSSKLRRSADYSGTSTENIILFESSSPLRRNSPKVYDFDTLGTTFDARKDDASALRNESSEILRSYSTDKPQNFSLEASPVKKENSSLNVLDTSSFDDAGFKFVNAIEKSTAKSNVEELKQTRFDALFEDFDNSAVLGITRFVSVNNGTDAFIPSKSDIFITNPRRTISLPTSGDDIIQASLLRQIEVLNNRLAMLEQVVHRMEYNTANPAQISESSSSTISNSELYRDRPQDVAFTIDYTYGSSVREEIPYNDGLCPVVDVHSSHRKGSIFSLRRVYRAWLCGSRRSMQRSSPVEV